MPMVQNIRQVSIAPLLPLALIPAFGNFVIL
jgi:hypothetical protein